MHRWEKRRARRTPYMSIFPTKVLLAIDGSKEAELAARSAAALADKTSSELHVVYVFGITPWYPAYPEAAGFDAAELKNPVLAEDLQRISEQRARELLDAEVEKLRSVGGTLAQAHLVEGGVPEEIVGLAEEIGAGLVVVGSRGRGGIRRALMGSASDSVVRHAHCPVLVVRDGERERDYLPGRILLAVDGSEEASAATRTAVDLADRTDSELHVVHVGELKPVYHPERRGYLARYEELQEEARRLLEEQVDEINSAGGSVSRAHLRIGRPDEEIVGLAEEIGAGLIATGSRGLGGMRRALMGSASDSIVRHAHCPVLVVRPEKEQTA
jgi:nucleotide-binding universal stress UspA family protein